MDICQIGNRLFWVEGYFKGWICMIVAAFFTFLAMLLAYFVIWFVYAQQVYEVAPPLYPLEGYS